MNRVLKLLMSPNVDLTSPSAILVESITPIGSISFSIWGSGIILKVIWANPSHHRPDDAITKGITQSPSKFSTMIRWTTSRSPPPRYPAANALFEMESISDSSPMCGSSAL